MNPEVGRYPQFGMTVEELNATLQAMGQPAIVPGQIEAWIATGLVKATPETRRAMEQRERLNALTAKQEKRLQAYMREGLGFDEAYSAVLRTDPRRTVVPKLAVAPLPPPRPPREGRKLSRAKRKAARDRK